MYKGLQIRVKLFTFLAMSVFYQVWVWFFFLAIVDHFVSQLFPEDFNFFSHLCFTESWEYFKGSFGISKWRFSYLNVCISLHICFARMLRYISLML